MDRFYATAAEVLIEHEAIVDKFVGDEVIGIFIPALTGERHARQAIDAGLALLRATGHETDAPWAPIGIGINTGVAFVGVVGTADHVEFTALGDDVNVTARLASAAAGGELLVTDATARAAGLGLDRSARAPAPGPARQVRGDRCLRVHARELLHDSPAIRHRALIRRQGRRGATIAARQRHEHVAGLRSLGGRRNSRAQSSEPWSPAVRTRRRGRCRRRRHLSRALPHRGGRERGDGHGRLYPAIRDILGQVMYADNFSVAVYDRDRKRIGHPFVAGRGHTGRRGTSVWQPYDPARPAI